MPNRRSQIALLGCAWLIAFNLNWSAHSQTRDALKITIGPEQKVMADGLQPFMFLSREGTLVVQAQLSNQMIFPGRWGTVRSTDGGKTWDPWLPAKAQGAGPFTEGNMTQSKDGTIQILEWSARGPNSDGYFIGRLWESRDDWKTLTGPIAAKFYLPQGKGGFDDGGKPVDELFLHRTLLEMPNGDLMTTAYGWFKEDSTPTAYLKSMNRFRSLLFRSQDRGRNWSLVSTIAVDQTVGEEGYNEPVMVRLTQGKHQGRLIALMRVGSNKAKWPNPLYQTESDDEGKTWSPPRALAFDGVNPELIEMRNGTLVAGFGWRTKESRQRGVRGPRHLGPEHGNYIAFSLDQGATWTQVTQVTKEPTTAYVTIREVSPNRLFMVYDIGDGWARKWAAYPNGIERATAGRFIEVQKNTAAQSPVEKSPQPIAKATNLLNYKVQLDVLWEGHDGKIEWFGPRVGVISRDKSVLLMQRVVIDANDVVLGMYDSRTDDGGKSWSTPSACGGMQRRPFGENGVEISPLDMVPGWHAKSKKLLALGATACYVPNAKEPIYANSQPIFATYSVYDEPGKKWSTWKSLDFPDPKHFFLACGGAAQWMDLPNGDILWPIYGMSHDAVGSNYNKAPFFSAVVKCRFDGQNLKYLEHGNELSVKTGRGLGEPSLTQFNGRYYLTLRNNARGYVATSSDGLHFEKPVPWTFDDGTDLGSYNTQQHWITHSDGLFLVYTRRGANNDHIIRNRAPLFMAQVDPKRLCVIRSSERILLPDKGAQYGNFGTVNVSPSETWVTELEGMQGDAKKPSDIARTAARGANNRVYLCRIQWEKPNQLVAP